MAVASGRLMANFLITTIHVNLVPNPIVKHGDATQIHLNSHY